MFKNNRFSMNKEITEQQIYCQFDGDCNIPIFDQDNWEQEEQNGSNTLKFIENDKENHVDSEMMEKINKQLQYSKQNFFRVNIKTEKKKQSCKNKLPPINSSKDIISNGSMVQIKNSQLLSIKGNNKSQSKNKALGSNKSSQLSSKNSQSILKQGYLQKKTDGVFFKWHRRYVALTTEKLVCFENQHKQKAISCINLKILQVKIQQNNEQIILDFMGECENLIFKAQNNKDKDQWLDWFRKVIGFQSKQNKMLLKTFVKPIYENKDAMVERQFIGTAQTGDILLFYTKHTGAKLQRFFTNSDFDHVAIVVKMKQRDIMVFQSNQLYGVSVYDWAQYMRYFDLYEKVTIRKLNYVRKSEIHHPILNFAKKNLGKKYDINAMKLLKFESDFDWQKAKNNFEDQERGYFCSELIAKVYKSVGLIETKKASGRYWPVDFSEKGELILKKGAWLGPEQPIILNKHVKSIV